MFESGAGGDFATYQGAATGSIYRLDLAKAHFQGLALNSFLSPLEEKEGRLLRIPEEIRCKICGSIFSTSSVMVDGEEVVDAFDL